MSNVHSLPRYRRHSVHSPSRHFLGSVTVLAAAITALACADSATPLEEPANTQSPHAGPPATVAWQQQARTLVGSHSLNPLAAGRVYAALAVAQYDAIARSDDVGYKDGTLPASGFGAGGRSRYELERGAVAGASWLVLNFFFGDAADVLEQQVRAEARSFGDNPHAQFERGLGYGVSSGSRMIDRLKADHFTEPWSGTVPTGSGKWVSSGAPAAPLLGKMTSYLLTSGAQFRAPAPPAFGSPAFQTDLSEISSLSSTRSAAQLASAQKWNYPNGTPTPPGYWNEVASAFIDSHRLDERAAAHVYALMHAAMMDALIGCWESKYTYWYLRPSQVDGSITLPIGLPNHPSYPSGHSCVSAAATTVLSRFFPNESTQLAEQLKQAGLSRLYGGIHYRFDIDAGANLGRATGEWAIGIDNASGLLSAIN